MKSTGEDWLGAPSAAKYLGVDLRTLYAIVDKGELPAYKIRRVIRLRRSDIGAYIERCRVPPGSLGHLYRPGDSGDARSAR